MNRRELLAGGASGLAAVLSGCLSGTVLGPPEVREQSGQTVERSIQTPITDESTAPAFATLVVGKRGFHLGEKRPHQVWVRNASGAQRDVTVEIAGGPDADQWFRWSDAFESGAQLAIELRSPRQYAITVGSGDRATTVEVPETRFDCNDSATDVVVRDSGIETSGIATDQGCSAF